MYLLAAYIHDLSPFAIRFPDSWPIAGIRWYGLSYVAGFLAAFFLLKQYQKYQKSPLSESEGYSLLSYLMVGVLLGGRLGYGLLYDTANTLSAPWSLFIPQNGGISGMASHGGFLGAFFAIVFFCHTYN
jgi:phosphatidylglycerol:prolipoprotein diacylglycerol transferase